MLAFATLFPGCQPDSIPHVQLEIYPSLVRVASGSKRIKTTHFTFPRAPLCRLYAASGYPASMEQSSSLQTTQLTGNAVDGYVATLRIAINR